MLNSPGIQHNLYTWYIIYLTHLREVLSSFGFGFLNSDGLLIDCGEEEKLLLSSDG